MKKVVSFLLLFMLGTTPGCASHSKDMFSTNHEAEIKFGLMEKDSAGCYYV